MTNRSREIQYPRLAARLRAALIDAVILVLTFFLLATILAEMMIPGIVKGAVFLTIFLFLEPGLVFMSGGTIGHHLMGLRIEDRDSGSNLNPFFALIRFVLKSGVGILSFAFILVTKKHQAIHDLASGSVVVVREPSKDRIDQLQQEQEIYDSQYEYPAAHERVGIIILYNGLALIVISAVFGIFVSEECLSTDSCNLVDSLLQLLGSLVWLVLFFVILSSGWRGRLPGARRWKKTRK